MKKLLIATTNEGKKAEIVRFLETLPFELVSISDLKEEITPPEETAGTLEGNALLKAKYYAKKTGLLSVADDSGLFIDALDGWPGVDAALVAKTADEKVSITLAKMQGIEKSQRTASFHNVLALVDPADDSYFVTSSKLIGEITTEPRGDITPFGYSKIFHVIESGKTYAEMDVDEKNGISHRSKSIQKLKYHLQNQYSGRNIIVPIALIARDGKLLMSLRSDPHRPEFDRVWEFPGGAVEFGEDVEETLKREVHEEVGYDIEIVSPPLQITTKAREEESFRYQVLLIPYVCKIVGGDGNANDAEVLETRWFDLVEVPKLHLFDNDDTMIRALTPTIKQIMKEHNL